MLKTNKWNEMIILSIMIEFYCMVNHSRSTYGDEDLLIFGHTLNYTVKSFKASSKPPSGQCYDWYYKHVKWLMNGVQIASTWSQTRRRPTIECDSLYYSSDY